MTAAALLIALAIAQAPSEAPRLLYAGSTIHASLAAGGRTGYSFDVPAQHAARLALRQEGIDVALTLRRAATIVPEHGLDMHAGTDGEERMFPSVLETPMTWLLVVSSSLPRVAGGNYTISLEIVPADDRDRAIAAARAAHYEASETAWRGDGKSFEAARAGYAAAAAAALAAGDAEQAAESTYQCARILDNLGDMPAAIEWQQRALTMFRGLGQREREARVLNRLGDLSRKVGDVVNADQYFRDALPIARDAGDPVTVADILNNSGLLLTTLGRYEEAIRQFERAIPLAQALNADSVEAASINNTGDAYTALGLYDLAIEAYQRAAPVVARLKLPRRTARNLLMLGVAQYQNGDRATANGSVEHSIALYEESGDRAGLGDALSIYSRMLQADGDTPRAVELFTRALPLVREVHNQRAETRILATWAEVEVERGHSDAALEKADLALAVAQAIAAPASIQQALYARALALRQLGRLAEASASMAEAITSIDTMRGALVHTELRTSYLAKLHDYFDLHVDLLQRRGLTAEAFEANEHARARTLLEGLAGSASRIDKGVDPELLARLRTVQTQLNAKESYRAQLAQQKGGADARVAALDTEIEGLLKQWNDARAAIRAAGPAYAALQTPDPVTVERVQRTLIDAATALVEFHTGTARSYAWVIDRSSVTVHELPPRERLDAAARRYHELLSRERDALPAPEQQALAREIDSAAKRLAALVWSPIAARAHAKRLLVVADGALQYVPFAALPSSTGVPLLAQHEIVYLPSASVLDTLRRERPATTSAIKAAVFADPVFSKTDVRFAAGTEAAPLPASTSRDGGPYERLRFSRKEADAIAAAIPGTFEALDFAASKNTIAGVDLRGFRILHFATHGSLNAEHPELSGLVFSLYDPQGRPIDGWLRLHEIYNLNLDADLVVLSACRTALGKEVYGEGLIGLTRGFMYAGASRVISSTWNVDDRASAVLMSRFYDALIARHRPAAAALREAQLSMLAEPRWSNPHYWAAFSLQGEWR